MHDFADEQSTALRYVSAPATFGVGDTVHPADAAEGVSSSAALAIRTRRTDLSDILLRRYASGQHRSSVGALFGARPAGGSPKTVTW
jgi:hypothetical protein